MMVDKWQMVVDVALLTQSLRHRSARQQARQLEHARHAGREKGAGGRDESLADSGDSLHVAALENALRREKETVRRLRITLREQATEMKDVLAAASRAKERPSATEQLQEGSRGHGDTRYVSLPNMRFLCGQFMTPGAYVAESARIGTRTCHTC